MDAAGLLPVILDRPCDETRALIARFTTAPTKARRRLIDQTIRALKSSGIWHKLDAFYMFAAADSQAALLNWRSTSFTATAESAPTFAADRGFTGDGAASYVDTQFTPSTNAVQMSLNDAMLALWSVTDVQSAGAGWFDGTQGMVVGPRSAANNYVGRINSATNTTVANSVGNGFVLGQRTGAGAVEFFLNTASVATNTTASVGLPTGTLKAGRTATATFSTIQNGALMFGRSLSVDQVAALSGIMTAYMRSVGAA